MLKIKYDRFILKVKRWLRNRWFNLQCWWERLTIRWKLFWDYFRFEHFEKFEDNWRRKHDFPPNKDGYK